MRAMEAGSVLMKLAQGGEVTLSEVEQNALDALESAGWIERAVDTGEAEARLAALRQELSGLTTQAARAANEARLRTEILALSEVVVRGRGAARVVRATGSAYRAERSGQSYVVTFAGRTLLGDLAPRLGRVGTLEIDLFRTHMDALRRTFAEKAQRAAELLRALRPATNGVSDSALRSVALGLSAKREPVSELAGNWRAYFQKLRTADAEQTLRTFRWQPDQEAAGAEALLLLPSSLRGERPAERLHELRVRCYDVYCERNAEDALDAAMHLMSAHPIENAVQDAVNLALQMKQVQTPMTLSVALAMRAARQLNQGAVFTYFFTELSRAKEGADDRERHAAALALMLSSTAPAATFARARELRGYLTRFATTGMLTPACLLATLPIETAEALDLLRLASAELQKARFECGGPEALTLAVKFLLQTVILAAGNEGDAEEQVGLIRFDGLALEALGHAGLASHIPLSLTTLAAFHRPALDAAIVYQELYQPMHSSSVFSGGHRSGGWG